MRKTLIAALLCMAGPAMSQGIPVFDASANVSIAKQLAEALRQVQIATQQLQQYRMMYDSVTGNRGIGSIISAVPGSVLPSDMRSIYYSASSMSASNITGPAQAILRSEVFNGSTAEMQAHVTARSKSATANNKALAEVAYADTQRDISDINRLTQEIARTQDAKAIAEVQASLTAKQASLAANQNRLILIAQANAAERGLIDEQRAEADRRILSSQNTYVPPIR